MQILKAPLEAAGRLLLGVLFLLAGISKLGSMEGFSQYLVGGGLPAFLAWPAAFFEVVAGVAIIVGFQTRIVALLLAGFCVITAIMYHYIPTDQVQMTMMMKNLAIAGGLLVLACNGAGQFSVDARR
jgi:putative oxidoreductase